MGSRDDEGKSAGQQLADKLLISKKNSWDGVLPEVLERIRIFGDHYKDFLNRGKTERECVAHMQEILAERGFRNLEGMETLEPGSRFFLNNRGKSLICGILGKQPLEDGVNLVGAHVDSPKIDLKTNPLYEDGELGYLDTHYYGGIKHYQWTVIPLALHGTVILRDGSKRELRIGEGEDDPVFTITDLLPHLSREIMSQKKVAEFINGEDLNVLAGSQSYQDSKVKEKVKLNILRLLNEQYGLVEQDFAAAELALVPAFKARDLGFDRSMIGAYGHDDRVCVFTAFRSLLELAGTEAPEKTAICVFTDKEETGSAGNTGAQSRFLENALAALLEIAGNDRPEGALRKCLSRSFMLSADVNAAFDPNFDSFFDRKTASFFGKGMTLSKATGSGGKVGGSDANGEYCVKVQGIFDRNAVPWQFGELGKVDKGGGGTIAKYVANLDVETLDCGVPVLSMHAPFEVISKIDLYHAFQGYLAFFREA